MINIKHLQGLKAVKNFKIPNVSATNISLLQGKLKYNEMTSLFKIAQLPIKNGYIRNLVLIQ